MQFKTEALRLQHPQISRIPTSVWRSTFGLSINKDWVALMEAKPEECIPVLERLASLDSHNKDEAWALIALCNPSLSPEALEQMAIQLKLPLSDCCYMAASIGNLVFIEYATQQTPNIDWDPDIIFRRAAQNGHIKIMQFVEKKAPETLQEIIASDNFYAYRHAAEYGYLDVLQHIEAIVPDEKLQGIIVSSYLYASEGAAEYGHLQVLQHFEAILPDKILQEMLVKWGFYAYQNAALNGHLHVMQHLEGKVSKLRLQDMIAGNDYRYFHIVAARGHLNVLRYLETKVTKEKLQTIIFKEHFTYHWTASEGHLDVLRYLETKMTDEILQKVLGLNDFEVFRKTALLQHTDVLKHLLSHTCVLAYAEARAHEEKNGGVVRSFISEQYTHIITEKNEFETGDSNAEFDVDEQKATRCFYMIRHFIRQNTPDALEKISILLSIPAVKNLAHREVYQGQPNELLHLAIDIGNQGAEMLLFRPSCYSGANCRLDQNVPGHQMCEILTIEILRTELHEFVRYHFETVLRTKDLEALHKAWDNLILDGNQEAIIPLKVMDVTKPKQEQFLNSMTAKYGAKLSEDPVLLSFVRLAFEFFGREETNCHALDFGVRVNLNSLFKYVKNNKTPHAECRFAFFNNVGEQKTKAPSSAFDTNNTP